MFKKSKLMVWILLLAAFVCVPALCMAQEAATGEVIMEGVEEEAAPSSGLWQVIAGSGWLGIVLWMALLATSIAALWLIIDFFITISPKRIIPEALVNDVR